MKNFKCPIKVLNTFITDSPIKSIIRQCGNQSEILNANRFKKLRKGKLEDKGYMP